MQEIKPGPAKIANPNLTEVSMSVSIPFDKLTFTAEIARGSFGIVHLGKWNHVDVAIKELKLKNLTPVQEHEFKKEAHLMVKLKAPNITQCFGVCVDRVPYCIVMEYMPKGSLTAVLKDPKITLSWPTRERIALDIACGLHFLHSEKILHRDLKSLNVLLDDHFKAKLCDFGLAKIKEEDKTFDASGFSPKGSVPWMAPELIQNPPQYSYYSDIYSFGVTLWEISSRRMPYSKANNRFVVFDLVRNGQREEIPQDCPPKIAHLIGQCWAQAPKDRPLTEYIINELKTNPLSEVNLLAADSIMDSLESTAPSVEFINPPSANPVAVVVPQNNPELSNDNHQQDSQKQTTSAQATVEVDKSEKQSEPLDQPEFIEPTPSTTDYTRKYPGGDEETRCVIF